MKIMPPVPALKNGKKYLVGYVGVMGQQEGIPYLLEAARYIVSTLKRSDIHFTLVGGGPALHDMKQLCRSYGLNDYVTFTGRVSDQKLLQVLNTADICINPDTVNAMNDKSTMNKIMEYIALGKPIVQFDVTEGRFSAGDASLYAKPNDAVDMALKIIELIDDPAKREAMGAFGRARVETELAWTFEAPKLLAAYDALFAVKEKAVA
jgi:glycosyltransferase involved in cell wall biosynthesis